MELAKIHAEFAEFRAAQTKEPGKIGWESKAVLRFVRARLDERFAALHAGNKEPVVVNVTVDTEPLARAIAEAIRGVAIAMLQRPKRSVSIEHSDGSRSTVREGQVPGQDIAGAT